MLVNNVVMLYVGICNLIENINYVVGSEIMYFICRVGEFLFLLDFLNKCLRLKNVILKIVFVLFVFIFKY